MTVHKLVLGLLVVWSFWPPLQARNNGDLDPKKAYQLVEDLFHNRKGKRKRALEKLMAANDPSIAPALVDALFFNKNGRDEVLQLLRHLLGVDVGPDYQPWVAEIGRRTDIEPKPGYRAFKAEKFAQIDPAFATFLDPKHPAEIRLEEVLWGGVKKDGIPALMNPPFLSVSQASYLDDNEPVFGVYLGGEAKAYPHRVMDWHEMVNDVVGGQPMSISYCTLCGAGILFDTRREGKEPYTFGSSGMLYRSNKLMYDHQTETLWSNLTGKPVIGPLLGKNIELPVLPLSVTTWGDWKKRYPETLVLSSQTGYFRDYSPGAAYGDYFNSDRLMFPVWNKPKQDSPYSDKDIVWVVVLGSSRKAYPLPKLVQQPLLYNKMGAVEILLITDPQTQAVRAYRSNNYKVVQIDGQLLLENGTPLTQTGTGLAKADGTVIMPRLPGHRTYWFAWKAFFPDGKAL